MIYQIKHKKTGSVIFEKDCDSTRECVEAAVGTDVYLGGADLNDANLNCANLSGACLIGAGLCGADLRYANLRDADLTDADLRGADLRGADLKGADLSCADLRGADLRCAELRNSDLRYADLTDACLTGACLRGAALTDAEIPTIKNIHKTVYRAASKDDALDMSAWHECETTHCRAGWVVTLAGAAGKELEREIGTAAAAALIYLKSDPELEKVPNFHDSNEDALADMKRLAEQ